MPAIPTVPTITLNNGVSIPQLGFGVFQVAPDEVIEPVETAIVCRLPSYRHCGGIPERERRREGNLQFRSLP